MCEPAACNPRAALAGKLIPKAPSGHYSHAPDYCSLRSCAQEGECTRIIFMAQQSCIWNLPIETSMSRKAGSPFGLLHELAFSAMRILELRALAVGAVAILLVVYFVACGEAATPRASRYARSHARELGDHFARRTVSVDAVERLST